MPRDGTLKISATSICRAVARRLSMAKKRYLPAALILLSGIGCPAGFAQAADGPPGQVRFFVDAKSNFSPWIKKPTETQKQFMRENYYRMQVYSPYFDKRLAWFPNAWEYEDAYKIKPDGDTVRRHPEWVMRDAAGNMLYIPYACKNGTCPQYAADFGNPEFRSYWIERLAKNMREGYIGIWVDDVNMQWRVGDGNGDHVKPMDPRTGKEMRLADWQRYLAEFMEEVRKRFPDAEIAHNVIFWAEPADGNSEYLLRQALAADYINLERGVTAGKGLAGGDGKYGFRTFLAYIDWVHSLGRNVILDDDDSDSIKDRNLELAFYFLINNGGDLIGADGDRARMNPDNFWSGYRLNLGKALGDRRENNGLFRRDFECGLALVNEPGQLSRSIDLGQPMTALSGRSVRVVTLKGGEGEVLVSGCQQDAEGF